LPEPGVNIKAFQITPCNLLNRNRPEKERCDGWWKVICAKTAIKKAQVFNTWAFL
jgi:phosphopantetheinyl transferase